MPKNNQRGFTLLEVLVALSFLTIISLSTIQLITRARQAADLARQDFVAVNLAREGLELVRATRDTNWFSTVDRSLWIQEDMCQSFTYDAAMLRARASVGSPAASALYIQQNGEWGHDVSGEPTQYEREFDVDCSEKDRDPGVVTITSRVTWQDRGLPHEVLLREKLYNWLP